MKKKDGLYQSYFIRQGYVCNTPQSDDYTIQGQQDTLVDSQIWQYEVYTFASRLIKKHHLKSVFDVGCGCAMKIKRLILPLTSDITGIDEPNTIAWNNTHHDFGMWLADNLENPQTDLRKKFDIILSVDVIEHLIVPDKLLKFIKKHASPETIIVISTPDRNIARSKNDNGPPGNDLHIREWSLSEFRQYIENSGFTIIKHFRVESFTPLAMQKLPRFIRKMAIVMLAWVRLIRLKRYPRDCQVMLLKVSK
jgi:SAM-dependent methyltransferase